MMPLFVRWMTTAPEAVYLYVPLMKDLGLRWTELQSLPKSELEGLLYALSQYSKLHQFDGYDADDVSEMAKNKPAIRSDYIAYLETKEKYEEKMGIKKPVKTPSQLAAELKL